jgi:hypothetical protein
MRAVVDRNARNRGDNKMDNAILNNLVDRPSDGWTKVIRVWTHYWLSARFIPAAVDQCRLNTAVGGTFIYVDAL